MPDIEFSLNVDQYKTAYGYPFTPNEFENVPKVDVNIRNAKCALGLWNL